MTKTFFPFPAGRAKGKRYGTMRTSILRYVTPMMIFSIAAIIFLIAQNFTVIYGYYMHGEVLNSLMLVVVSVGLGLAFNNNIQLYLTARYLKRIEKIQEQGLATPEQVDKLRASLERSAHMLNMAAFNERLDFLQTQGHLNFTNDSARLVKSKFGHRVADHRAKVNYFCGILVMLGLIGTFWGLLGTITTVGQAMTKISDNFAAQAGGGGAADIDMAGFLSSISKPLEGMGVGFSASLFGLTGSLFLGFFNYLAAYAQNKFIEDFSRWIDDRIPSMSNALVEKARTINGPASDDLKAWLAGYIYLANKTHRRMGHIVTALNRVNETAQLSMRQVERLFANQKSIAGAIEAGNQKLGDMSGALRRVTSDIVPANAVMKDILGAITQGNQKMVAMHSTLKALPRGGDGSMAMMERISNNIGLLTDSMTEYAHINSQVGQSQIEHLSGLMGHIRSQVGTFEQMQELQGDMLRELKSLTQADNQIEEITSIPDIADRAHLADGKDDAELLEIFAQGVSNATVPEKA